MAGRLEETGGGACVIIGVITERQCYNKVRIRAAEEGRIDSSLVARAMNRRIKDNGRSLCSILSFRDAMKEDLFIPLVSSLSHARERDLKWPREMRRERRCSERIAGDKNSQ